MSIRKNLIAYLALFVALGGTSYAALTLPADSVGTPQLRDGAVTSAKVRQHSLTASVFRAGALPKGSRTIVIPEPIHTTIAAGNTLPPSCGASGCGTFPAGDSLSASAYCPKGTQVVGGGYAIDPSAQTTTETAAASEPFPGRWEVTFTLTQPGPFAPTGDVYAVCAS